MLNYCSNILFTNPEHIKCALGNAFNTIILNYMKKTYQQNLKSKKEKRKQPPHSSIGIEDNKKLQHE